MKTLEQTKEEYAIVYCQYPSWEDFINDIPSDEVESHMNEVAKIYADECGKDICECKPCKRINRMKTHEITTSKGEFAAVDYPTDCHISQISIGCGETDLAIGFPDGTFKRLPFNYKLICKLSEATEEDAKLIVDEPERFFNPTNPYCVDDIIYPNYLGGDRFWFATQSLHSLIKSKGITGDNLYIFNKIK